MTTSNDSFTASIGYDPTICVFSESYLRSGDPEVIYQWNGSLNIALLILDLAFGSVPGLPVHMSFNDPTNLPVAISMFLCGLFGFMLNLFCAWSILKNKKIALCVKYYLLFDCYCRLNQAWTLFYQIHCVFTWQCIDPNGSPISALTINMLISSCNYGMVYSMQMLTHGLSVNRFFAVFFKGLFYSKAEQIAAPHAIILWILPIIPICYQIGYMIDPFTNFICYVGWYFTPLHYSLASPYQRDSLSLFFAYHIDQFMYGVLGLTILLDLSTLWRVRRMKSNSESKKRGDLRMLIMLISTHVVSICFLVVNFIAGFNYEQALPLQFYLMLGVFPFLIHCVYGLIVIVFTSTQRFNSKRIVTPRNTDLTKSQIR